MEPWFDTHVHLDAYPAEERGALLRRAADAGVGAVLSVGDAVGPAVDGVRVYRAAGLHPLRSDEYAGTGTLASLATGPSVVAIGETGFDRAGPPLKVQARVFEGHCAVAAKLGLALILHIDQEWERIRGFLEAVGSLRVVRHYFTGPEEQADWHAEHGHYLSLGKPLLRMPHLKEVAVSYPADRLLVETDSYPLAGRTTEPRDTGAIGEAVASAREWSMEQCREQLWTNSLRAFGL